MKKLAILGMGLCIALAFSSCKSSESAYKKAYEKAKQQELAEPQTAEPVEVAPTVTAPVEARVVESTPVATAGVRQEKVEVVNCRRDAGPVACAAVFAPSLAARFALLRSRMSPARSSTFSAVPPGSAAE